MKTLFSFCCIILILTSCNQPDELPTNELPTKVARKVSIKVATELGNDFAEGGLYVHKTDDFLTLRSSHLSSFKRHIDPMRILFENISLETGGEILHYPITIGKTWEYRWNSKKVTTLEGFETVEIAFGTFEQCLKHKTVITEAHIGNKLEKEIIDGTRYLWFAKGVGIVKMRYEHSNGVNTDAELTDYNITGKSDEYFPLNIGSTWTYKWKNDYHNEEFIEQAYLDVYSGNRDHIKGSLQLTATVNSISNQELGKREFYIKKTASTLTINQASSRPGIKSTTEIEYPTSIFSDNISTSWPEMFRYPLTVGKTWTEEGWSNSYLQTTIEDYESVKCAAGDFTKCLKHKTVFTGAEAETALKSTLINGTRYLWFAKGVGLVKMRYEHSNGVITEAELIDYNVPGGSSDYFPLNVNTSWTYRWQNDYHTNPIIEKLHVNDPNVLPETPISKAYYTVTIEDPMKPGEMKVNYILYPEELTFEKMMLRLNGDNDYIPQHSKFIPDDSEYDIKKHHRMRGLKVEPGAIGPPHFEDYPYPVWNIKFFKHGNKNPITIDYEISQKYAKSYKDFTFKRHGITYLSQSSPYFRDDCMFWPSGNLFIVGGKTDKIEVEFNLPDGWNVLTPWKRIGNTGHKFSVKNQDELTSNFLLIGEHVEVSAKSGETEVLIGMGGSLKASKDEMQRTVEKFLNAYSKVFNGGPAERVVFSVNPYEGTGEKRMKGVGRMNSVSIQMDETLDMDTKHEWGPFLAHEVFHIWNGLTALSPFTGKERWFVEGVTNYYSDITSKQLGYLSESQWLERLESACEDYLSVSHEFAIGDYFRDSRLLYEGGSLVAASLDFQIRHLTKNRKNFNHVMQEMYRKFPDNSIEYTYHDIIRSVNKVSGKDFDTFFKSYVTGKERLPLSEYFNYAGLDVQIEYSEELPTSDYVSKVIRDNIEHKSWRLISVNGTKVDKFADLRESAKSWKSGDVFEMTFEVDGNTITEPVTLSKIPDKPETSRDASVKITKKSDPTRLQRRILADIL